MNPKGQGIIQNSRRSRKQGFKTKSHQDDKGDTMKRNNWKTQRSVCGLIVQYIQKTHVKTQVESIMWAEHNWTQEQKLNVVQIPRTMTK